MLKIPRHLKDKVEATSTPEEGNDGYWVYLKKGWHFKNMECHTAHEYTLKELRHVLRKDNIIAVEDDWD